MVRDVEKPVDNVVPLIKVLEAQPVGIPYWAFEQGLVVAPAHEMPMQASNDETASTDRVPLYWPKGLPLNPFITPLIGVFL